MKYLPDFYTSVSKVGVGVQHDEDKGDQQVEEEPNINHLYVGCFRETLTNLRWKFYFHIFPS